MILEMKIRIGGQEKKIRMKNKLYIITGPAGVGKSTISNRIAQLSSKSVLIEGDSIYALVKSGYISPWKKGNHLELFWKNCISLIRNCLEDGYDVVFNYIIGKQKLEDLKNEFYDFETKFVVLLASEEIILKRDKFRSEDCQMNERCLILLENTLYVLMPNGLVTKLS